jgi:hypothetical protein
LNRLFRHQGAWQIPGTAAVFFLLLFSAKNQRAQPAVVFEKLPAKKTGIEFRNQLTESLNFNIIEYEYFYNGGGVAAGDLNNDGWVDLYFTGNMVPNQLYFNKGHWKFEEAAQKAGVAGRADWKTGVTMADVNADGWLDLYLCYSGKGDSLSRRHELFINQKNGTFKEEAEKFGLDLLDYSTQATFFDYDLDGDLDVFMLNHNIETLRRFDAAEMKPLRDRYIGCKLLRNDSGKFVDVSESANIKGNPINFGLGAAVADFNSDGWPDLYVSNDYLEQDYFYFNNGDGTFTDQLEKTVGHVSYFSMGNDAGDFNNDGWIDLVTLDMLPPGNFRQKLLFAPENYEFYQNMVKKKFYHQQMRNMLQLNNGDGTFSEIGQYAGISNTDWSWGALFADFDNNGWRDLLVTSGYPRDLISMEFQKFYADERLKANEGQKNERILQMLAQVPSNPIQSFLFSNNADHTFTDRSAEWGFGEKGFCNGAVYADLDNDGDLDIVTNRLNDVAGIYENKLRQAGFLTVNFSNPGSANPFGIGASAIVYSGGIRQVQEFYPSRGFQSAVHIPLHFGITATLIDSLVVKWPDGKQQKWNALKSGRHLTAIYSEATPAAAAAKKVSPPPAFIHRNDLLQYLNREDQYIDFKQQPLMPNMISYGGPKCARGDVNGDGLEDFYFCGAKNIPGKLFLQAPDGRFTESEQPALQTGIASHDADAVFFDADGDGDRDLYVVSGGYQFNAGDSLLQDRLYFNEQGIFKRLRSALPKETHSGSCVRPADLDGDGDLDLFVGGRVVPGRYPEPPASMFLINDGKGNFTDQTEAVCPELKNPGLVTDAIWLQLNGDARPDLVVVGEWMPVKVWENDGGKLSDVSEKYIPENSSGWWNRIFGDDFDGDGDVDLVIGNAGKNSQMKVSSRQPAEMWFGDFDKNGSMDPLIFYYIGDTLSPLASRDEMLDQMISLRKKFPSYHRYAGARVNDIVPDDQRLPTQPLRTERFETTYLENKGSYFEYRPLPAPAQFSPVHAITSLDYDADGNKDLVLAGNVQHARIRFGISDANYGQLYRGDGKGNFYYVQQAESGFSVRGDVRDLFTFTNRTGTFVVFAINQQPAQVYQLHRK